MVAKIKQEVFNGGFYRTNGYASYARHLACVPHLLEQTENKGENALPFSPRRHLHETDVV